MLIDLARTVVVFDLDDTLYLEADYVDSGIRHVCELIHSLYDMDHYSAIQESRLQNVNRDWLAVACELTSLNLSVKESLLWMYRLHLPDISLTDSCLSALNKIQSAAQAVAILTDGRTVTQRLKLAALGLSDWKAYISEDYGSTKPAPDRFIAIQNDFPADQYVYIADNLKTDFLGCNPLGWITVGMRGTDRNIHSQSKQGLSACHMPAFWVDGWDELIELLLNS